MTNNNSVFEYEPNYLGDVPETPIPPVEETPVIEPATSKNGGARFFAVIFTLLAVACILLPCYVVVGNKMKTMKILDVLMQTVTANNLIFGVIPTLATVSEPLGQFAGLSVYLMALCLVLAIVFGIIAVCSTKTAPCKLRASVFLLTFGVAIFFIANGLFAFEHHYGFMESIKGALYLLIVVAVGALAYLVLAFAKVGKRAWLNVLQALISIANVGLILAFLAKTGTTIDSIYALIGLQNMAETLTLVLYLVLTLSLILAALKLPSKKNTAAECIRYVVMALLTVVIAYLGFVKTKTNLTMLVAGAASVCAVLNLIIFAISGPKKEKVEAPISDVVTNNTTVEESVVEMPAVETVPSQDEYIREEYAEALPYEGGPVEGVEVAQEVNPTFTAPPVEVQTAGYDFYNSKSFDPFIAILNNEERNQFTEIFILKYKGVMPELPDYVVGGENKEFFRKLFIYLGQYRDRIPDGLLAKIYQFAIRL